MNAKFTKKKLSPINCKMDRQDLINSSSSILILYKENDLEKCVIEATELHKNVHESLKNRPGQNFGESFFKPLIEIVSCEIKLFSNEISCLTVDHCSLLSSVFKCIRNSFYKSSSNQNIIAKSYNYMNTLVSILKILLENFAPLSRERNGLDDFSGDINRSENLGNWKNMCSEAVSTCLTTFVNLMAGNPSVRKLLWPYLQPHLMNFISFPVPDVSHIGSAVLHHFLLEEEFSEFIVSSSGVFTVLSNLLNLYMQKGVHSCFTLFCLELLLPAFDIIPMNFENFNFKESLLALDIITAVIQRGPVRTQKRPFSLATIKYFQEYFKKRADKILQAHKPCIDSYEPNIITRMANLLCAGASSDEFQKHMQEDKSLLITTVYILKTITDIGNNSPNDFSRLTDDAREKDNETVHPAYGFKTDLIRLVAGLVYKNKTNQDVVRDIEGITLLLENSQYDSRNPLIREASVYALRNILENNSENQKIISDLQCRGVAENSTLEQLGLRAILQGGNIYLNQITI